MRNVNKAITYSVPAPTGGVNTRDSLDAMSPLDAVSMINWLPESGSCRVRDGYAEHSTGMGSGDVETLFEYHSGASRKLIACANNNIYDATLATAVSLGSGYANNRWSIANFNGNAHFANGGDNPLSYDGTSISSPAWSGTGLTISDLVGVNVFKNRLFFWESDSQDFWYAAINAESGTLTKFPLSRVSQFGGKLIAMATWTLDGGEGKDDYAVFIMTSGDVIVYAGTDPGSASDWALVGVYHISEPIANRCVAKIGGDLIIGTIKDYISLTGVLRTGDVGEASKISGAVLQEAGDNIDRFGWQFLLDNSSNLFISNIPQADGSYDQHVQNTRTGAWTIFNGYPSVSWAEFNRDLYFGGNDGKVYKITGNTDNGSFISADCSQAWNDFRSSSPKRFIAVRSIISTNTINLDYGLGLGFDFQPVASITTPESTPENLALWDVALWDEAQWAELNLINTEWRIFGGTGQNVSPKLKLNAEQSAKWLRTDYRYERGINL